MSSLRPRYFFHHLMWTLKRPARSVESNKKLVAMLRETLCRANHAFNRLTIVHAGEIGFRVPKDRLPWSTLEGELEKEGYAIHNWPQGVFRERDKGVYSLTAEEADKLYHALFSGERCLQFVRCDGGTFSSHCVVYLLTFLQRMAKGRLARCLAPRSFLTGSVQCGTATQETARVRCIPHHTSTIGDRQLEEMHDEKMLSSDDGQREVGSTDNPDMYALENTHLPTCDVTNCTACETPLCSIARFGLSPSTLWITIVQEEYYQPRWRLGSGV